MHLVRHGSKMGALMKRHTAVVLASCWARIISTSIFLVPEDGGNDDREYDNWWDLHLLSDWSTGGL